MNIGDKITDLAKDFSGVIVNIIGSRACVQWTHRNGRETAKILEQIDIKYLIQQ